MEAQAQETTRRSADREGSEQAPIVVEDEDLFRTVERGDIDVAVWCDGETLGERAPIRQYREKLRYITVECRCRVGLAKKYCQTGTEQCGDLDARGQSAHDVSPFSNINRFVGIRIELRLDPEGSRAYTGNVQPRRCPASLSAQSGLSSHCRHTLINKQRIKASRSPKGQKRRHSNRPPRRCNIKRKTEAGDARAYHGV